MSVGLLSTIYVSATGDMRVIYTCPTAMYATVNVNIANPLDNESNYSLFFSSEGTATVSNSSAPYGLEVGHQLGGLQSIERTGFVLSAGESLMIKGLKGFHAVQAWGFERSA